MRRSYASFGIWLVATLAALIVVARASYTTDLSAFLPAAPTETQRLLVDQLREGLVSRLILIDVEGANAASRGRLSSEIATALRATPEFRSVMNGEMTGLDRDRAFVFEHRYLLSDQVTPERFSSSGLAAAISEGIDFLSTPLGLVARDLFVRDPTGETLRALAQLEPAAHQPRTIDGRWVSADGTRALLIAETRAAGSDTDGQEQAIKLIRVAFANAGGKPAGAVLHLTGPGAFAVDARAAIKRDALRLSIFSALVIATLLTFIYRSATAVALGLLPVLSGALAGVAAVALGFDVVHGVTLGFGGTLIGEAVDYSVYLFLQAQHGQASDPEAWIRSFWPTVRLGMLTSICGFASLLPSAFPGLAQLGLYSIAGLAAAGLVTRFVLPALVPGRLRLGAALRIGEVLGRLLARLRPLRRALWLVPVVAALALYGQRGHLWSHELAALSPVPASAQALDGKLRADLGAPDARTLVVLEGADPDAVLHASELAGTALDVLVHDGVIGGYQSPSRFLPSSAVQQARRASLPPRAELADRLKTAVAALPVRAERLQPFLDDVEAARRAATVVRRDLEGTAIATGFDALLLQHGARFSALLPLEAAGDTSTAPPIDVARVAHALAAVPLAPVVATVVDLKQASDSLYSGYLSEALRLSLLGAGAILVLLVCTLRSAARVLRVLLPLALALLAVLGGFALLGRALTILHLVGLLLVIAIGSNYALFFDRAPTHADPNESARLLASLAVANLTTVIAFGALSLSSIPVLAALGETVAPGAWLALLFAALLARAPTTAPRGS